jgi:acyl dehydratase
MARQLKDWFGPEALRKFSVRFSKQVWPGDTLTFTAKVTAVSDNVADVECTATNQDGVEVLTGTARAAI